MNSLLQTLLRAGRRAIRLRQRHDAVRVLQVGLQGLLVGGLQCVVQVFRFSAEVTVEPPVTPRGNTTSCYCEGTAGASLSSVSLPDGTCSRTNSLFPCSKSLGTMNKGADGTRAGMLTLGRNFCDSQSHYQMEIKEAHLQEH